MKKFLIILCALSLVFVSACDNRSNTQNDTTTLADYKSSTTEAIKNKFTSNDITSNTVATENLSTKDEQTPFDNTENKTEDGFSKSKKETTSQTDKGTTNTEVNNFNSKNQSEEIITKGSPPFCYFTLEQLKTYKNACETMSEKEFERFVKNSRNFADSNIDNLETAQTVMKAIEDTTVILLDGEKSNFYEIAYHEKSLYISQPVIMSETKNLVCTYYTNLSEENVKTHHENTEYITYLTDVTANGVTANVYIYPNGDVDELYAEMFVDGTRITYRVTEEQTIEEFEADFARLQFVKIGDLLKE